MNNKLSPEDFQISGQNTESNLFTTASTRTFVMFWLTLILCISGFILTATAQQAERRLPNPGDTASKADLPEISGQTTELGGTVDKILDGSFETSTSEFPDAINTNWVQAGSSPPLCGVGGCSSFPATRTGKYRAVFQGGLPNPSSIQQNNVIFSTGSRPVIKFWVKANHVTAPFDVTLTLKIDNNVIFTITEPSVADSEFRQFAVTVPAVYVNGGQRSIKFESIGSATSGTSNFTLDDISLEQEILRDGGLETSTGDFPSVNSFWVQTSTINNPPLCGPLCTSNLPRTGNYRAWFGGDSDAETATMQQNNVVFSPGSRPVLKYWLRIPTVTAPFTDTLTVKIDGNVIKTIIEPAVAQSAYSLVSVAIPPGYADGNPHSIRFEYIHPVSSSSANFLVDDISIDENAIADNGFEATIGNPLVNPNWTSTSTVFGTSFCNLAACSASLQRSGNFWLWLGGTSNAETGTGQQSVVIPAGSRPVLKYWLRIGAVSSPFNATFKVIVDGTTIQTITEPAVAEVPYSQRSIAIPAAFADGAAHTIKFEYVNPAGSGGSNFHVEDVTLDTSAAATDFDGDRKADISIFRPSVGEWYFQRSSTGATNGAQFGASTDKPTPADYTGDGKADFAFYRPSTGQWFILRSEDSSFFAFPFGTSTDIPTPGDFDGDGKADAAVFRPSVGTWFISNSSGGVTIQPFGVNGDRPVVADYDGDGKSDIAIYRPSVGEWYTLRSSDGEVRGAQFGSSTDKTVQGDYTGDGKADFAFYRPSTGSWFVLRSEDFSFFASPFGNATDTPTIGDYDGDGKFDQAVFRPSTGQWILNRSTAGVQFATFGTSTDLPVPAYYLP
jgi:FG-GAP-like repeat